MQKAEVPGDTERRLEEDAERRLEEDAERRLEEDAEASRGGRRGALTPLRRTPRRLDALDS